MKHFFRISHLLVLFTFSLFSFPFAHAPDTLWTRTFVRDINNEGTCVQQTFDGGFIITGYTGNFVLLNRSTKAWILRTNSFGDTLWTQTYEYDTLTKAFFIQQTADSCFIVCGTSTVKKLTWLLRLNQQGTIVWSKQFTGNYHEMIFSRYCNFGISIHATSDGGYIFSGTGLDSAQLVKTDSSGNHVWRKHYYLNRLNQHYITSFTKYVYKTPSNGFLFTGATLVEDTGETEHKWVILTDSAGDTIWTDYFPGYNSPQYPFIAGVQPTIGNGYVIAQTGRDNLQGNYILLQKYDLTMRKIWTQTYGINDSLRVYIKDVWHTHENGFLITGLYDYFSEFKNILLIKTDSLGNKQWIDSITEEGNQYFNYIQLCSDGGYICVGSSSSTRNDSSKLWLVRKGKEITAIKNPYLKNYIFNSIKVLQKNNCIQFSSCFPNRCNVNLFIFNISGQLIKNVTSMSNKEGDYRYLWDISKLSSGWYYIKLEANAVIKTRNFLIIK